MNLLDALIVLCSVLALSLVWQHVNISAIAKNASKRYCKQHDVQFLDQSVVLNSIAFQRSKSSFIELKRRFVFEFSSVGDSRYKGTVIMLGSKVESIELEPYKLNFTKQ